MAYEIIFAPEAIEDLQRLRALDRSGIITAIETHLRHAPRKESKTRIKHASEDDWLDYRLEHDPGFLDRIASARASIQAGRGVRLENLNAALKRAEAPNALQRTGAAVTPAAFARPAAQGPRRAGQSLSLGSLGL